MIRRKILVVTIVLFIIGATLIIINIFGLFMSLRNDNIYSDKRTYFKEDITLSYDEVKSLIKRKRNETNIAYAVRVNKAVNKGIAHYWNQEDVMLYNLRVPIWENYFLYLAQFIFPGRYRMYEFFNYHKALERGIGLCSQQSMIVSSILNKNGIGSDIINLEGHVVVRAEVENDVFYTLDPDYGIVIPYDIRAIENNTDIVKPYYDRIKPDIRDRDENISKKMKKIYEKEGNVIFYERVSAYGPQKYYIELFAYYTKWILPLLVMLPCIILLWGRDYLGNLTKKTLHRIKGCPRL